MVSGKGEVGAGVLEGGLGGDVVPGDGVIGTPPWASLASCGPGGGFAADIVVG